jgi:malate dehydrogenase (oxaloacetate-decarboxylating)(NADP+)
MTTKRPSFTDEEALAFHRYPQPGKLSVTPPSRWPRSATCRWPIRRASPSPCLAIAEGQGAAYDYTSKGNMVAVITNGTAILGLGNLGALASKPVMEGKSVLFKRFADVDSIDIEVDDRRTREIHQLRARHRRHFGGINLEDIKAPECFIIESACAKLDIPVFHDDQHGTAIIATAGLINACEITGRHRQDDCKVVNGAGAAGLSVHRPDPPVSASARQRHPALRPQGRHLRRAAPRAWTSSSPPCDDTKRARSPKPSKAPTCSSASPPRAR